MKWQTKSGEWIKISDMSKKHLKNTIRYLQVIPTISKLYDDGMNPPFIQKEHDTEMIELMCQELESRS